MKKYAAALAAAAILALPLTARADTSPAVNRVILNQALQQQMQNQINTQQTQLETQQNQLRANVQSQMQQNNAALQYILLEQQLELIKIEQRAHTHSSSSHKTHRHS